MSELIIIPNPLLSAVSLPVNDEGISDLLDRMTLTMREHRGIGLAAVQIGVLKRVVLVDTSSGAQPPLIFVNPRLVWTSEESTELEEGCLSIPGIRENVVRPSGIMLHYETQAREERCEKFEGITARCLQHELDHLNGVLFLDHLSRLKRTRAIKKFNKIRF